MKLPLAPFHCRDESRPVPWVLLFPVYTPQLTTPHVASTLLSHQRTPVSAESGRAARTNGPLLDWIIISGRQVLRLPAYREVEYSPQQSQRGEAAFVFSEKLRVDRLRIFPHRAAAKVLELSCLLPCRVQDS